MLFVVKRFVNLVIALFLVATLTFFLMKAIPGDPFMQEEAIPEEILHAMRRHYGLDKPLITQYIKYMKRIATFSLGPSFKYEGRTVNQIIMSGFPISLTLGLFALAIALFFGLLLGIFSAMYRGKWQDQLFMVLAVLGISTPSFILATMLQYVFAMKLSWLPLARWGDFNHMILPAFALAALPTAFIARLIRSSMVEVLAQDYVLMARAKGQKGFELVRRHVLKNSLLPVVSYIGHVSSTILTGSFVIEKIFGIPGLGNWFVSSIANRDYTMIMGITIFFSAILMVMTFLIDVAYFLIDPRIYRSYRLSHA